jgi:hypothetical protein
MLKILFSKPEGGQIPWFLFDFQRWNHDQPFRQWDNEPPEPMTVTLTVVTTVADHYCPIANIKSGLPPGDNALQPDICAMKQEQLAK